MNDLILIFIGLFILIIFIALFILLYYMNDKYISYTYEVNDNLTKSEQIINDTSKAFNKLQDNVINRMATVDNNQKNIIDTSSNTVNRINSNLLNVFDIINNNNKINNLITSNIDTNKSLDLNIKPNVITYKNVSTLTNNSQYINICDDNIDPLKRKCLNINIDNEGIFNIYTSNKLNNNSNVNTVAIRDNNNNIMALFNGSNKTIALGSNISPAINITNNVYTPDIIVCNYKYEKGEKIPDNRIMLNFISNFDIKPNSFVNFIIPEQYINAISFINNDYTSINFNNSVLKIQPKTAISKNIINQWNIPVEYINSAVVDNSTKFNTNGFITLS